MAVRKKFFSSCVSWPRHRIDELVAMLETASPIPRSAFVAQVDRHDLKRLEKMLGYASKRSEGLTMADDWHIKYRRGKLFGESVVYFVHSAIEFVFVSECVAYQLRSEQ